MVKNKIPSTKTPAYTIWILLAIVTGLGIFLYSLLGIWGIFILLVFLAFSTPLYTESNVPAFNALILVNSWTGGMRVIFPGINFKFPWENAQEEDNKKKYIDLRVELSEVLSETYASQDALMETKYVYTIRPNISEDNGEDAGEKILIYSSFESSAIKAKGRALFSMLLSDYYGSKPGKELLDKAKINKKVFGPTEEEEEDAIKKFEEKHGVEVSVRLEDSDFDKATQKFRDMISGAKSIDEAITVFMTDTKLPDGTIIKGMERPQAEKFVKLLNTEGYSEKDFNLNVNAPHLTNLRDVSIIGGLTDDKKGGKK